jgi:Copper type II ascorbate-dependent monooxygenase, C-terminal domain
VPIHLYLVAPHMHLLGRKMHVTATLPAGSQKCLINVDDWDFNWQGMYQYKDPVAIPSNTKLAVEAYYDNSSDNWRNPNTPPKPVSWGEQTTDEMCIAFLGFTIDAENLATGQRVNADRIFGQAR